MGIVTDCFSFRKIDKEKAVAQDFDAMIMEQPSISALSIRENNGNLPMKQQQSRNHTSSTPVNLTPKMHNSRKQSKDPKSVKSKFNKTHSYAISTATIGRKKQIL